MKLEALSLQMSLKLLISLPQFMRLLERDNLSTATYQAIPLEFISTIRNLLLLKKIKMKL